MNGYDQTIAGLATVGTNTRRIDNNGAGVATLTFDFPSGTHRNFGGNIGGTSPVFIVKNGTGSQQIGRKDPITPMAGATINEGRLRLDGPILPIGSVTVKSGADLVVNVGAADALEDVDPDGDGWSNLMEYAFGGNPDDGGIVGNVPAYGKSLVDGTNWFTYTYAYRTDPASGLEYTLESSGNLVYVPWSESNHTLLGIGEIDAGFSTQTNGVLLDANNAYFFKLLVEKQ